jgi:Uma2 family endonuclease
MPMATVESPPRDVKNLADLQERLGGVPLERIRYRPFPGTATEADLLAIDAHEDRPCELIDGVLVEKPMGLRESILAGAILAFLRAFVIPRDLGFVTAPDGPMRLLPGLVRLPDVAFVAWTTVPGGRVPEEAIPDLAPDLAVEVLSPSNTPREMTLKRRHYFEAGVRLVWIVDPKRRTVAAYTGPDRPARLDASATLDGGDVLPGFAFPLADLFADLDRRAPG